MEAHFDLRGAKASLLKCESFLNDLCRLLRIESRGIDTNLLSHAPAQEFEDRLAFRFAENIPKRNIDAAQGDDPKPS